MGGCDQGVEGADFTSCECGFDVQESLFVLLWSPLFKGGVLGSAIDGKEEVIFCRIES